MHWAWRSYNELTKDELYDLLALRQEVFIFEQHCFCIDADYLDQKSIHFLGYEEDKLAAYLRILPNGLLYPEAFSIGRVLTAPFARKKGLAKKMLEQALHYIKNQNGTCIILSAQLYLEKFYAEFGFETISQPYDDAGIAHIDMRKYVL